MPTTTRANGREQTTYVVRHEMGYREADGITTFRDGTVRTITHDADGTKTVVWDRPIDLRLVAGFLVEA